MAVWAFWLWNSLMAGGARQGFPSHTNTVPSYQSRAGGRDGNTGQEKQRPSKMGRDRPQLGKLPSQRKEAQSGGVERELEPLM